MTTVKAVLFDLDGTLVDTAPDFVFVVNEQRARHGLAALDDSGIRNAVSNGARALIQLSFGLSAEEEGFAPLLDELLELYLSELAVRSCLFDGMEAVLSELESRHIPWGIVTNKPRRFTQPLLKGLGLDRRCAVTVCPDDVTNTKPDPEPLFLACSKIKVTPQSTVYVGDHARDIQAGKNAGMRTIAAAYGYISSPEEARQWHADHSVNHPLEITDYLPEESSHV
ncbi:MAG: phosphoglycolate phosphatase [Gammaproteobacteria bacterium]|nr:MAG: phosphoglycolate phosphatase [Pseudomonadota bacterium]PIE38453.1 MAG: phosphoglycolate phosphatase [Gammaproteobacteria bacterium]